VKFSANTESLKLYFPRFAPNALLAPTPQASLIGSLALDTGGNEGLVHAMFFVAAQPSEKLVPELLWLHLSESQTDEEHLPFLDHANLFVNGQDEIVTKLVSLQTETHRYVIFSQNERRRRLGANFQNGTSRLFVMRPKEK
jgi:hypothetical protein